MFAHNGLVSAHVSEWTRGTALTRGPHIELAHCCSTLVHPREGERLSSQLLSQSHFNIKCDVFHWRHQQLHLWCYSETSS